MFFPHLILSVSKSPPPFNQGQIEKNTILGFVISNMHNNSCLPGDVKKMYKPLKATIVMLLYRIYSDADKSLISRFI